MTTSPTVIRPGDVRVHSTRTGDKTYRQVLKAAFVASLVCWLGFNIYQTVLHIVRYYVPLPVWDYWRVVENLEGYRHFDFATLWRQHNEHRIFFPKLFFAADVRWWHGRQILPL